MKEKNGGHRVVRKLSIESRQNDTNRASVYLWKDEGDVVHMSNVPNENCPQKYSYYDCRFQVSYLYLREILVRILFLCNQDKLYEVFAACGVKIGGPA